MISKYTAFLTLIIVIISMKNIEIKRIVKILFAFNLIVLAIHISMYIIYLLLDSSSLNFLVRNTLEGQVIRYSFFFNHPNVFAMYVFWTVAMYYYLYFDKIKNMSYFLTIILSICIYVFPNSKTSALAILILLILIFLKKKNIKMPSAKYIFIIVLIFSIVSIFFIQNSFIMKINEALSGRITLGKIIFDNYGINLFGADVTKGVEETVVNDKYYTNIKIIDSVYYTLLLNYGIVALLIYTYLILGAIKSVDKQGDDIEKVFIIMLIIYGISETTCLSPEIAFPVLFLSKTLKEKLWKKKLVS